MTVSAERAARTEARMRAAAALRELGMTWKEIGGVLGLSAPRALSLARYRGQRQDGPKPRHPAPPPSLEEGIERLRAIFSPDHPL
jgi:hypothetical protein